jgi:lipopolysaccharide transport system ATP-binding protein
MYVRLAFAVAAHLEPEILIIDEVLAVGDAEFQKKCLGKMDEVAKGGRTVLFVSHNMGAVESLCSKGILMKDGKTNHFGTTTSTIDHYMSSNSITANYYKNINPRSDSDILSISIQNSINNRSSTFKFNEDITINFNLQVSEKHLNAVLGVRIKDQHERNIFTTQFNLKENHFNAGKHVLEVVIPKNILVPNNYIVIVGFHVPNQEIIRLLENIAFQIEETGTDFYQYAGKDYGCVFIDCKWKIV